MKTHNKIPIIISATTARRTKVNACRDCHIENGKDCTDYRSNQQYIYVHLFDWLKRSEGILLDSSGQPNVIGHDTWLEDSACSYIRHRNVTLCDLGKAHAPIVTNIWTHSGVLPALTWRAWFGVDLDHFSRCELKNIFLRCGLETFFEAPNFKDTLRGK